MRYDRNGQYVLDIPMSKKDCVVPWCDGEAYAYGGHPWETHFCDEHLGTIDSHKVLIFPYNSQINIDISRKNANLFLDVLSLLGLDIEFIWIEPKTQSKYFVFEGGTLVGISSVKEYRPEYIYRDGQQYHPATSKGKNENA